MFIKLKHELIKIIEKIPLLQIFIYNNLQYFNFLFPHDKDYYALKLLFSPNEKGAFLDVGGNIGLSAIGFRELGFKNNKIHIFEPDNDLIDKYLSKVKKKYNKISIFPIGLSNKNHSQKLFKAYYKNYFFHFNNSFDYRYIKKKLQHNYGKKSREFNIKSTIYTLKKFDDIDLKDKISFIKIDVEGMDHLVLMGMKKFLKKNKPKILVEYNQSNFKIIYKILKKNYYCYFFNFEKNLLTKLNDRECRSLIKGKILEKKFNKNSVNIYFIDKNTKNFE
tara:strand:+ start:313 stop:1143 length:831 start_codon:yes stop_codon:yes gene_type:complete